MTTPMVDGHRPHYTESPTRKTEATVAYTRWLLEEKKRIAEQLRKQYGWED